MGLIPTAFITDLLARTDIVELVDARVPLKKAGRNYHACCPFHTEKTPSFTVSPGKQFYHCFGCGASGNAIGFIMQYDRLDFVDAVETLARQLGIEVPREAGATAKAEHSADLYTVLQAAKRYYQQQLRKSSQAIDYLKGRGISGEIARRYGIGFAPASRDGLLHQAQPAELLQKAGLVLHKTQGKGYYDRFRERIMFPIHDRRGRVVGFGGRVLDNSLPKYLNSPETPVFHKSQVLYGLYEARQANTALAQLWVVEGYMDVVALAQAGLTEVVATLGTAITSQQVQQLFQHTNQVVFCFDGDRAGYAAAWRALEATLPVLQDDTQALFLFLPEGQDPDSLVRAEGVEKLRARLAQATSLADFFFNRLKQQADSATLEGRSKLAHDALPYLEKMTAPLMREMLLDKLAGMVRMEKSRLAQFAMGLAPAAKPAHRGKLHKTPMWLAVALLLQHPELMHDAPIDITALTLPGSELLQQMADLLQQCPTLTTASLLEHWRDKPAFGYLEKLAVWTHNVPEQGLKAEWQGVLRHLAQLQREHAINTLMQKANQSALTKEERQQLQALLAGG